MYITDRFIDESFIGKEYTSPKHKELASMICLGNPNIKTKDTLVEAVDIINKIPIDKVDKITFKELEEMGWQFGFYGVGG